jgi:putative NIF3 family GTP cyclohydrolase 1 type 2
VAAPGVSDALARALGLDVIGPILPSPGLPSPGQPSPGRSGLGQPTGPEHALRGLGRFGALPEPTSLRSFAARVAEALPATSAGVRVSGDPDRPVRLVAVCGGAGDDRALLAAVRAAGADAYVTADLRHHPALEAREAGGFASPDGGPALVDVAHWASEWPWLGEAARLLAGALGAGGGATGDNLEIRVSALVTDPWSLHLPQKHSDVLD